MSQYFLIKEHNYDKIDGKCMGQDRSLLPGSYNSFEDATNYASTYKQEKDDVIKVVELVGKCWGFVK